MKVVGKSRVLPDSALTVISNLSFDLSLLKSFQNSSTITPISKELLSALCEQSRILSDTIAVIKDQLGPLVGDEMVVVAAASEKSIDEVIGYQKDACYDTPTHQKEDESAESQNDNPPAVELPAAEESSKVEDKRQFDFYENLHNVQLSHSLEKMNLNDHPNRQFSSPIERNKEHQDKSKEEDSQQQQQYQQQQKNLLSPNQSSEISLNNEPIALNDEMYQKRQSERKMQLAQQIKQNLSSIRADQDLPQQFQVVPAVNEKKKANDHLNQRVEEDPKRYSRKQLVIATCLSLIVLVFGCICSYLTGSSFLPSIIHSNSCNEPPQSVISYEDTSAFQLHLQAAVDNEERIQQCTLRTVDLSMRLKLCVEDSEKFSRTSNDMLMNLEMKTRDVQEKSQSIAICQEQLRECTVENLSCQEIQAINAELTQVLELYARTP